MYFCCSQSELLLYLLLLLLIFSSLLSLLFCWWYLESLSAGYSRLWCSQAFYASSSYSGEKHHSDILSFIFLVRVKSKISTKLQVGAHCTWQLRLNTVPARIPGENIVNFYSRHQPTNCNIIKVCSTIVLVDRMILLQLFSETITEVICHSAGERCGGSMYYSCKQVRY